MTTPLIIATPMDALNPLASTSSTITSLFPKLPLDDDSRFSGFISMVTGLGQAIAEEE